MRLPFCCEFVAPMLAWAFGCAVQNGDAEIAIGSELAELCNLSASWHGLLSGRAGLAVTGRTPFEDALGRMLAVSDGYRHSLWRMNKLIEAA